MTGRVHLFNALTTALIASVFLMYLSCKDEMEKFTKEHNFSMAFATRAGNTSADGLVPRMRLFTFGQNTKTFHSEALNITRTANKLSTRLETGTWNLAMVSSSSDYVLVAPKANVAMDDLPMYVYQPVVDKGRSASAAELFFQNKLTPAITAGTNSGMEAQLNRVVAKVELIIQNATPNFNLSGNHKIFLHDVPSTVSYTGRLLPDAANPTLLSNPLEAPVTLVQGTNGFLKASETIEFIIPAHQGSDFLSDAPSDVIGKKMSVAVDFERAGGGSRFTKTVEIDKVALCNRVLRVNISINDGIALDTSVLPWERVDISGNVGRGFQNWLYVKEGGQGSGLSWNDALPDITSAIKNANALTGIGKTVHGILVAGGNTVAYPGGFTLPANLKLYGGWKGTSGTELASDDTTGPYTSVNRDLKTAKARIDTGSESIVLSEAGTVLDGFIVEGSGDTQAKGLISLAHASAWINAVEIDDQATIGSDHALSISEGVGMNVLITRNNKGVSVTDRSRLINATIANNAQASVFTGTLLNSVYWGNAGAAVTTGAINYCVFQGTPPAGTNYPVSDTNDRWFTANNVIPGPHFDLGATSGLARYEVGTVKPTRSPMLRRGSKASFDNNLPITLDDAYKKDINGDTRFHTSIDGTTQVVDIGCYENATHKGFQLRWATENVYVSAKKGYSSQMPLLLPANEDPDINVGITWTVTVEGGSLTDCVFDGSVVNQVATGSNTGSGTGVMVGIIQFTPSVDYTKNKERKLGTIHITTNLGIYLPDTKLEVWQTAGAQSKWAKGFVGSFHRNKERGARFIYAESSVDKEWSVRIFSGNDWIKIDANDKDYGADITDPDEGKTPSGDYYKEVEEAWGGVITGKGSDIKFRVGMKSKNTTGRPRYGLIIISGTEKISYFFVRQGEEADYVYRTEDTRPSFGDRTATYVKKFATYNITDPQGRESKNGTDVGTNGGVFTQYPTQAGYYFKLNSSVGFLHGVASVVGEFNGTTTYAPEKEVCPAGYRRATQLEYINSLYFDVKDTKSGNVSPGAENSRKNFESGAYADGWFDQLLPSKLDNPSNTSLGSKHGLAMKGILIVNHYNYASVFFPAAGTMNTSGNIINGQYAMYYTDVQQNLHWQVTDSSGHLGMNCTRLALNEAATVRCVYAGN